MKIAAEKIAAERLELTEASLKIIDQLNRQQQASE